MNRQRNDPLLNHNIPQTQQAAIRDAPKKESPFTKLKLKKTKTRLQFNK